MRDCPLAFCTSCCWPPACWLSFISWQTITCWLALIGRLALFCSQSVCPLSGSCCLLLRPAPINSSVRQFFLFEKTPVAEESMLTSMPHEWCPMHGWFGMDFSMDILSDLFTLGCKYMWAWMCVYVLQIKWCRVIENSDSMGKKCFYHISLMVVEATFIE